MKTMKNTFKKSMALLAFVAVFAMIFTGCKKDDSSSSSGGGNNPTPPTPGNYGTVTVAGQSYNIAAGVHEIYFDEDLGQNIVSLELADRVDGSEDTNGFVAEIIGIDNLPANGTYQFILQEQMPAGSCAGCFVSSQGLLYCTSGTITVSGTSASYNIQASGSAMPMGGGNNMSFSVNFNGPLPLYEE